MRILQTIDIPNDPELDLVSMYAQVHTIKTPPHYRLWVRERLFSKPLERENSENRIVQKWKDFKLYLIEH